MYTPVPGPYSYTGSQYHSANPAKYNQVVKATATFIATGSYANVSAFYLSGSSAATVTLVNGGQIQLTAPAAGYSSIIYEMGVYSVDAGTVYLLYK